MYPIKADKIGVTCKFGPRTYTYKGPVLPIIPSFCPLTTLSPIFTTIEPDFI